MDEFQTENIDLLNFINKKRLDNNDVEPKKIFFLFTKSIRTSVINTYSQHRNLAFSLSCTDLITNIFWLIYTYSYNAKLTMFMCERAVLLFNEYINISKTYGNEKTNLLDVKQFIINKTIGPLKLPSKENSYDISEINTLGDLYIKFIYSVFTKIIQLDNFYYNYEDFFESISCILSNIMYKIYHCGMKDYIEIQLTKLASYDIYDLPREVNLLKIKLELFYYSYELINNERESIKLSELIISNHLDIIDELDDINDFFDCQIKIQDREFYGKLILKLKKHIG
jgi:hypothetical protein